MTSDSKERTLLNQYRFFLGFTGMFVVSLTMTFKNYLIVGEVLAHATAMNLPAEALAFIKDFNWGDARLLDTGGTLKQVITQAERGRLSADCHRVGGSGHIFTVLQLSFDQRAYRAAERPGQ